MANMKDVAKKAGVSVATVSHVINETRHVSEPTRQRVIESMQDLNYKPNQVARGLRKKKTKTIGFIIPDITNFFFNELTFYIEKHLQDKGYSIILANSNESLQQEKKQLKTLNSHRIDGLIIAPTRGNHKYLDEIRSEYNYPMVFIDRKPEGIEGVSVLTDNVKGAFWAVEHLIENGHKNIGIIAGLPEITSTVERLEGYCKALESYDMPIEEEYIQYGDSSYESGYQQAEKLLKLDALTAIFAGNNLMATGALTYLNKNNVFIPDEMAVVSFDDFKWAEVTCPALTAVKQPASHIAKTAADLLVKKIEDERLHDKKSQVIRAEPEFISRQSV